MALFFKGIDGRPEYPDRTEYEGAVLIEWENNGYNDSDFYAAVWDDDAGEIKSIQWGTTRFPTYGNGCKVDATPEVIEKAKAYRRSKAEKYVRRDLDARNEAEARYPHKGRTVTVVKGRKVPKGTTGEVIWIGEDRYAGRYDRGVDRMRIGLKDADGTVHWTAARNVKVVDHEQYLRPASELAEKAERIIEAESRRVFGRQFA